MSSKLLRQTIRRNLIVFRILLIIFGCISVSWAIFVLPIFWRATSVERTAKRIIGGEPFRIETLIRQIPILKSIEKSEYFNSPSIRSAAIIRLRTVETLISAGEKNKVDAELKPLENSIISSLGNLPADPFLWLALFSVESSWIGSTKDQVKYLRLSYRLGPNEGWIGLRRNGIALARFERLPPDLKEAAISEFVSLLNSGFYSNMAKIFTGPGWSIRELILPRLKEVAERYRQGFADDLHRRGFEVTVPGIIPPEPRMAH
jgi:hypothetical protein